MSLYKQRGSKFLWINLSHNGERVRQSSGETDRTEAQRRHDELKVELWKTQPKVRGRTWGMAVVHWTALQPRSDSELLSLAKFGKRFPDRRLVDVTREDIDKVLSSFCKTAGTYTRYRTMINAILNAAKAEGWLREVPKLATRKDKKTKPREWITQEQWAKLLAELPAHMKPMATFAIETGLRQANVLGLTWSRVDLERKVVWVEAEDTKGDAAIAVPLSIGAVNVLKAVKGQHAEFVFTYRSKPVKEVKTAFIAACVRAGVGAYTSGAAGAVVPPDGRSLPGLPVRPSPATTGQPSPRSAGRGTVDAAQGIRRGEDRDDAVCRPTYVGFTWHGFRHTWATWHIQNGTPLEVLQKLGGWADLRMVMRYAHHSPGHLASFADNARKKEEWPTSVDRPASGAGVSSVAHVRSTSVIGACSRSGDL